LDEFALIPQFQEKKTEDEKESEGEE